MKKVIAVLLSTIVLLCGCEKMNQLIVTPEEIVLFTEDTEQISTNTESAIYSSKDDFYASVDQSGLVTANKVGTTSVILTGGDKSITIPIKVMSKYSLYPNLDEIIGKTESDVRAKVSSSYTIDDGMWLYKDITQYASVGITYENGKVKNAVAFVPTSYTLMLTDALIERYSVAGMQNDYFYFLNHNRDVVITLIVYTYDYLAVVYTAYTVLKAPFEMPSADLDAEFKNLVL